MKYFVYCRKSSEGEERQALSIPAQIDEIKRIFADMPQVEIVEWLEEKMSAKAPGRPVYSQMIKRIEAGEADGIVAWHPDRLARNSVDGGWIIHLLDRGVLKDMKFASYTYENSPQGMFMLQIMFGQSKYYVDNLSVNVKRGRRKKIAMGWHPGRPPLGYINDKAASTIIPDPDRFELVERMWRLLLSGACGPDEIRRIATEEWGLRTRPARKRGGGPIAHSSIYRLFSNPFYAGIVVANGEWHPGKHPPMISIDEFNRAQAIIGAPGYAKPKVYEFAFTGGMIRCPCGLTVTAEQKTKTSGRVYVYYHCTRRNYPRCSQPSIRSEALEAEITNVLERLSLFPGLESWLTDQTALTEDAEVAQRERHARSINKSLSGAETQLRVLVDMRTRDLIGDEEFVAKRRDLQSEVLSLRGAIQSEGIQDSETRFELAKCLDLFNKYAANWFSKANPSEKRLILETVGSNCQLVDGKLNIEARFPFEMLSADPQYLSLRDKVFYMGTDPAQKDRVKRLISAVRHLEACAEARRVGGELPLDLLPTPRRSGRNKSVQETRKRALLQSIKEDNAA